MPDAPRKPWGFSRNCYTWMLLPMSFQYHAQTKNYIRYYIYINGAFNIHREIIYWYNLSFHNSLLKITVQIALNFPHYNSPFYTFPESKPDHELLTQALALSKEILQHIDNQIDARAKEQRLIEIFNKVDARSSAMYRGKKFKVLIAEMILPSKACFDVNRSYTSFVGTSQ